MRMVVTEAGGGGSLIVTSGEPQEKGVLSYRFGLFWAIRPSSQGRMLPPEDTTMLP